MVYREIQCRGRSRTHCGLLTRLSDRIYARAARPEWRGGGLRISENKGRRWVDGVVWAVLCSKTESRTARSGARIFRHLLWDISPSRATKIRGGTERGLAMGCCWSREWDGSRVVSPARFPKPPSALRVPSSALEYPHREYG